jgi:hypothetical protein
LPKVGKPRSPGKQFSDQKGSTMWISRQLTGSASRRLVVTVGVLTLSTAALVTAASPAAAVVPGGMTSVSVVSAFDSTQSKSAVATCPAGQNVIGTGATLAAGGDVAIEAIVPDLGLTSVTVTAKEADPYAGNWSVTAYAQCAPPLPGQVRVMVNNLASSVSPRAITANCPAGTTALGIGYDVGNGFGEVLVNQVVPNGGPGVAANQVTVTAYEDDPYLADWTLTAFLICADPIAGQQVVTAASTVTSMPSNGVPAACPPGQDMTGGSAEVRPAVAADLSELSVNAVFPNAGSNLAVAFEEDPIGGNWRVLSYALCT